MSPTELRSLVDDRHRADFFRQWHQTKRLYLDAHTANQIVRDFYAAEKKQIDPATNVRNIAESE